VPPWRPYLWAARGSRWLAVRCQDESLLDLSALPIPVQGLDASPLRVIAFEE
jgi:hypothetical protein